MSEGKFKKKIEELLNHLEHNGYNDGFHVAEDDTEKFWDIFSEAKTDFPYKSHEIKEPIIFDTEYRSWDMTELYRWFVKWFGDE